MDCVNKNFLPNLCQQEDVKFGFLCPTKKLDIANVNYDHVPTLLESPKQLYVTVRFPPPSDFMPGTIVRFVILGSPKYNFPNEQSNLFMVDDIVGLRIILVPFQPNEKRKDIYLPNDPSSCFNSSLGSGWGFNMRKQGISSFMKDWIYGYGNTVAQIEYQPRTNSSQWYYLREARCTY